jgi:heterodisulfide reductase subunit B2
MTSFAYFPGCASEGSGREFADTMEVVIKALDHDLQEIPDWNCCGASSAHSVSEFLSLALPGRDLVKAEEMGLDVLAPCAACYSRLATAALELPRQRELEGEAQSSFRGDVHVVHPLKLLSRPESMARVSSKLTRTLKDLPVVTYYGCLAVRPAAVTGITGTELENPTMMDEVLELLGARVIDWAHKTSCCGASQTLPKPILARNLTLEIVDCAVASGAEAIVTGCPLCFLNLELQQVQAKTDGDREQPHIPVFYISELMALCMGIGDLKLAFENHLIPVDGPLAARELSWR